MHCFNVKRTGCRNISTANLSVECCSTISPVSEQGKGRKEGRKRNTCAWVCDVSREYSQIKCNIHSKTNFNKEKESESEKGGCANFQLNFYSAKATLDGQDQKIKCPVTSLKVIYFIHLLTCTPFPSSCIQLFTHPSR